MKPRSLLATLGIIALCSLCFTGFAIATQTGYILTDYQGTITTVDGKASTGEWDDSWKGYLYSGNLSTTDSFRVKWAADGDIYYDFWLIEILSDTTNDTGDYVQICYDGSIDGGTAPKPDDYLLNYTGHSNATLYIGTGTGWSTTTDRSVQVASSISASNASATPHWIVEIKFDVGDWMNTGDRVAAYDASTGKTLTWPPNSNASVPDGYGLNEVSMETIPEGLSIGVTVLLSTAALVVGARYFRKPGRITR
jgi:hypothetical protein